MTWYHINTRRISLQMCLFWNDGLNQKEKNTYGIGVTKFLNYFDGHKTEYYVDIDEWEAYRIGQKVLLDLRVLVKTIPWEAQDYLEKQLKRWNESFPKDLKSLSTGVLLSLHLQIAEEVAWTNSRTWMIYLINDLIAEKVRGGLLKHLGDEQKTEEYLLAFSSPLEMNEAVKERVELLLLWKEKKILPNVSFQEKLKIHAKKFEHIPMFGFDHIPYTVVDFMKMIEEIGDGEAELKNLTGTLELRQEQFAKQLQELNLKETDELFDLIHLLKHTVFVRDYRDTLRQKMYLLDRYFYDEVGRRLGDYAAEEITNLTNDEIQSALKDPEFKIKDIIEERKKGFLIIQENEKITVYSGDEARAVAEKELGKNQVENIKTIQGVPASPGLASGPAKIISTNQDLDKIMPGDVMIALMTRQDFVPAMRKCVAVVTDEGGITNHAAIVCREFKLPCVVGTKIATKIIKDGDMVEVDANLGTIKIL